MGPRVNRRFAVQFEEMSPAPAGAMADVVGRLTDALAVAAEHGWVNEEEARRLWWRYQGQVDESAPQAAVGEVAE